MTGLTHVQSTPLNPAVVLVPGNLLGLYLRRALALQDGSAGHANVRFLTLVDLARSFCSQHLWENGKIEPPPLVADLVFERAVAATIPDTEYFSKLAKQKQPEPSLLSAITDLKEACITPQELERWANASSLAEEGRGKLKDLIRIHSEYDRRLDALGFVDRNDVLRQSTNVIPDARDASYFAYGFYDFNPLQKKLVAALLQKQEALFFLPWGEGAAFDYALPSLTWLKNLGCEHVLLEPREESSLDRLARGMFNSAAAKPVMESPQNSLSIISAPGEAKEVQEIVREALRWVERDGFKFSEIAFLLRGNEPYAPLLIETLSRLEIPFYLNGGTPLLKSRAGQSFRLLLAMLRDNFSRSSVMEFISYAPIAPKHFGDAVELQSEIAQWDLFAIQAGVVGGESEWRSRLGRLHGRMTEGYQDPDEPEDGASQSGLGSLERFQRFLAHLFERLKNIPPQGRWSDLARSFAALLRDTFVPTPETERVADEIELLGKLDLIDEAVDLVRFSRVAETALTGARENSDGFGKGGIFIGDVMSARGLPFRAVIVPGMVEKFFPRAWRQDPILLDHERQYISEGLGKELAQKNKQYDEERLLFAFALLAAREKILFSFPRLEMLTARERIPSFFLLRLMEAASGKAVSFADFETWDVVRRVPLSRLFPPTPKEALDPLEYDLHHAERIASGVDFSSLEYLSELSPFFDAGFKAEAERWGEKRFTPFDGVLRGKKAQAQLNRLYRDQTLNFSATALERYARCPFRFFVERLLRLPILEEPDPFDRLSPLDRGTLMHDILFRFLDRLKREGRLPMKQQPAEGLRAILTQVSDPVLASYETEKAAGFPLLWRIDREEIVEDLRGWLEAELRGDGGFLPAELEITFSCPFPLAGSEVIHLRGRIDRIDVAPERRTAAIIDYKTGKPQHLKDGEFHGGEALQLPIYLLASEHLLKDVEPSEASYYYVSRNGKYQKDCFTRVDWGKKLEKLRVILGGLVREIRGGLFIARPPSCGQCEYPWICTPAADVLFERKRTDPRIANLERIKEIP